MATPESTLAVFRASRPLGQCRHSADVLVFFANAAVTSAGWRLVASGSAVNGMPNSATLNRLDDPSYDPLDGWNGWDDAHAFSYAPETTTGERHVQEGVVDPYGTMELRSMTLGDACVFTVVVNTTPTTTSSNSYTIELDKYVNASYAVSDPARAIRDAGALCAALNETIFTRIALPTPARTGGVATSTQGAAYTGREERAGPSTCPPTGPYPPVGLPTGPYPPGPPPGARFDPYGPPDVPEFAPGRFGRNEFDPTYGFPENPDHVFGGVPDGLGPWPGGNVGPGRGGVPRGGVPGRGGRGAFPPPGWPSGRGRGPPDLGPPPQGGGGFL